MKKIGLAIIFIISSLYCYAIPTIQLPFIIKSSHEDKIGFSSSLIDPHFHYHKNYQLAYYTHADFYLLCKNAVSEKEILEHYELYAYPEFCKYASTLHGYNDFIKHLNGIIKTDKKFRKQTTHIPGFSSTFGLRSYTSGFHDFIEQEVQRIEKLELQKNAHVLYCATSDLLHDWSSRRKNIRNNRDAAKRLDARIQAVDKWSKGNKTALQD